MKPYRYVFCLAQPPISVSHWKCYGQPNLVLTVRREGDHLSLQENDEPKQEIFPETQTDFFSKVTDDEVTFQFDSQTHAIKMILHVDGRDIPMKRLD